MVDSPSMATAFINEFFGQDSYLRLLPELLRSDILDLTGLSANGYTCSKCQKRWLVPRRVATEVQYCRCCYETFYLCETCYPKHRDEFGRPNHRRRAYLKFRERSRAARKAKRLVEIASRNRVKYVIPDLDLSFYTCTIKFLDDRK